jgi:anti-anti-sigma factor
MGVRIKLDKWNGTPLLRVGGKAGSGDVLKLSRKLEKVMKKARERAILDLRDMAFLDSNWMGVLIGCERLYRENGKLLVFLVQAGFMRDLFRNAGLDRLFKIVESLESLEMLEDGPEAASADATGRS